MSVHRKKDGRWVVKIYDADKDSKYRWEYYGRGPTAEAKARERDRELDFKRTKPRLKEEQGPSFFELAEDYLVQRNFNANSEKQCKIRLASIIVPTLGDKTALLLSHDDLDRYIATRRKTVKMSTIRRELTDIKAILNWAAKRRPPLLPFNPVRDFQLPPADDAVIPPPTQQEVGAILAHANERLVRAIKLAYFTGLRPGKVEMLSLRWDSVLWDTGVIRITSADKGGPKLREVPIHPDFEKELKAWRDSDNNPYGPIIHQNGRPVKCLHVAWAFAKKNAGIPARRRLRLYDLRHWYATTAIESGCDYKTLSEIMGSSPETLRKHYQHVSSAARISLVNRMPDLPPVSAKIDVAKPKEKKKQGKGNKKPAQKRKQRQLLATVGYFHSWRLDL
jgi:integrase